MGNEILLNEQFKTLVKELEYYLKEIEKGHLQQVDEESFVFKMASGNFLIHFQAMPPTGYLIIKTYEFVTNKGSLVASKIHVEDLDISSRLVNNNSFHNSFEKDNVLITNFPVDYFRRLSVYLEAKNT
jgi:hypothetical protein